VSTTLRSDVMRNHNFRGAGVLGHASAAMTLDVYAGLFGDSVQVVAEEARVDVEGHRGGGVPEHTRPSEVVVAHHVTSQGRGHQIVGRLAGDVLREASTSDRGIGTERRWCVFGVPYVISPFSSIAVCTTSIRRFIRSTRRTRTAAASPFSALGSRTPVAGVRGRRPSRTARSSISENTRCTWRTVAWTQRYEHGIPVADLEPIDADDTTGTTVHFMPEEAVNESLLHRLLN